jgi:epoxide hydrolase 4
VSRTSGALGAESALLVGHDWAGSIAWTIAMNHPEVVDRLVILNAAHPRKLSEGLRNPNQLGKSWCEEAWSLKDRETHSVEFVA